MSTLRKRLADIEERQAFRDWQLSQRQFEGRSADEMQFFVLHGYWPENATELPDRIEFTTRGIKTIVTTQWADENQKT